MRSFLLLVLAALVAMVLWAGLVFWGTLNGWTRTALAPAGNAPAFIAAAEREIASKHPGNAAFRLLENGKLAGEYFIGDSVDRDTLFQVASLSKWLTAWGVMTLVDAGRLDLDAPVASYLKRWSLPESEFDNNQVTARRLLSHKAGLTDGLGYGGFPPGVALQSLEESLTRAADASPGADGRVRVGIAPGTQWKYSGGGFTLLQLVIEEITGEPFASYMQRAVFQPLGMNRSTYAIEPGLTPNVAELYGTDGKVLTPPRFTATAAASFYTSASDLTAFMQAHLPGAAGEPIGRGVLKPETVKLMRQPHAAQLGADIWGLGTMLYAPNGAGDFIIGHDGKRSPAINSTARLNPSTGDGIVLLESGHPLLATLVAGEWTFWQTGTIDFLAFTLVAKDMLALILLGWGAIILAALFIGWRLLRRKKVAKSA